MLYVISYKRYVEYKMIVNKKAKVHPVELLRILIPD